MLLLVSSMSAGGRSVRLGPRIVRILRGGGWEVAVRLTTPGDDPAAIAGRLAVLLEAAGELWAASGHYARASRTAVRRFAFREAGELASRGLDCLARNRG